MPIQDGEYVRLSEDEIQDALEAELQTEFGENIDLTESSVFSTLTGVLAAVLNENQEQSIGEVYRSAFIETATGRDLERVVALLGLQRRSAVHATGIERFEASGKVSQDYVIQRGTAVQTLGPDPVEFETTEPVALELIDDFEGGSLADYSGDTGDASVVSQYAYEGSESLQLDAVAGAHIYDDSVSLDQGTTLHGHARPRAGTVPIFTFAVQNGGGDYYQVALDEANNEARIEVVEGGSVTSTIDTTTVTLNADTYYEMEVDWNITDNIGVSVKDANGDELATLGGVDATYQTGAVGFKSGDVNDAKNLDFYTTSAVSADIRAVEGGGSGNLGANTLESVPSPPAGVETATNPYPTGDTSYEDTSGSEFRIGEDEETDRELRERALNVASGGGSATHDAIVGHIINTVEAATSVTLFENKTDDDNTDSGGLPSHSFEAVVFGGSDAEVADAIFDKKAVTSRDYGGVNGVEVTETAVADTNGQERVISFSRPNPINVDLDLDLVVNDNYIGDDELRNRIVQYIGGTTADGSTTVGLGVSENVIIDHLRDIIVGASDTGVIAFDNSVDGTPLESTPSQTVVDGIDVIQVGNIEVAQTDATDASITLNTREQ
jgi:uncharacterized phage protein gp47/JayE